MDRMSVDSKEAERITIGIVARKAAVSLQYRLARPLTIVAGLSGGRFQRRVSIGGFFRFSQGFLLFLGSALLFLRLLTLTFGVSLRSWPAHKVSSFHGDLVSYSIRISTIRLRRISRYVAPTAQCAIDGVIVRCLSRRNVPITTSLVTRVPEDEESRPDAGLALPHAGFSRTIGSVDEASVIDVHVRQLNGGRPGP